MSTVDVNLARVQRFLAALQAPVTPMKRFFHLDALRIEIPNRPDPNRRESDDCFNPR